jgi:glycosyltransferase involved in cell wall biosynthesis
MRNSAGAEWRTLQLYRLLGPRANVTVWSDEAPDPRMAALLPIRRIRMHRLQLPWTGTLVMVGVYHRYGRWIHLARPSRIVLIYNTDDPALLRRRLARAAAWRRVPVEVVFASTWLRDSVGVAGPVQPSPIDLARFYPSASARDGQPFTVGRLSRDVPDKHHAGDPGLYRRLASAGMSVRILGGKVLRAELSGDAGVTLLAAGVEEAGAFLRGLDCFLYRTHAGYREPSGRVVQEAMACGVPVVCAAGGGYEELIEHGRNGFLFGSDDEALAIVARLRAEPALRASIGAAGRRTIEALFSPEALARISDFYLSGGGQR